MTRTEDTLICAYLSDVTIDSFMGTSYCDDETPSHNELVERVRGYIEEMVDSESGHYVLRSMANAMIEHIDWNAIVREMVQAKEREAIIREGI